MFDFDWAEQEGVVAGAIGRAFVAALLVTGSAGLAESAVRRAIDAWGEPEDQEGLLRTALRVAVEAQEECPEPPSEDREGAGAMLPAELQGILRLAAHPRRCFVFRLIAGWSRHDCARLLRLSSNEFNEHISTALHCLLLARA